MRETKAGFTWANIVLKGNRENKGSKFEFEAKNEVLVAYKNNKPVAVAPAIITPVHPETDKCITAEKIKRQISWLCWAFLRRKNGELLRD